MKTSTIFYPTLLALALSALTPVALAQAPDTSANTTMADDDDDDYGYWGLLGLLGLAGLLMRRKEHRDTRPDSTQRR